MTNIDTQIIFDKNGNPIPQYLDVADKTGGSAGTMKPITGQNGAQFTQVTGSNDAKIVEIASTSQNTPLAVNEWFVIADNFKEDRFKKYRVVINLLNTRSIEFRAEFRTNSRNYPVFVETFELSSDRHYAFEIPAWTDYIRTDGFRFRLNSELDTTVLATSVLGVR